MKRLNNKPADLQDWQIVEFLSAHKGSRYRASDIAKRLKVSSNRFAMLLAPLVERGEIRSAVNGKNREYFVPTQAEIDLAERMKNGGQRGIPFRPLSKALARGPRDFARRCAAARNPKTGMV